LGLAAREPLYVIEIDPARDALIVGPSSQLSREDLTASAVNWISGEPLREPARVTARVRYRSPGASAGVTSLGEERIRVRFDHPQRAIAPGQGVAMYVDDVLLGGGLIDRPERREVLGSR
jgi:tRNA-specific 2-thiouridylase